MTLTEILANEELRRREFPVARDKIFLAHAGVCPLPRRVADAIADCAATPRSATRKLSCCTGSTTRASSARNC